MARNFPVTSTLVLVALAAPLAQAAFPVSFDDWTDLRPGAPILPDDWLTVSTLHGEARHTVCTANFLFRGSDGARYLATAGHCAPLGDEEVVLWPAGEGPVARHGTRVDTAVPIGRFVFAASNMVETAIPVPFLGFEPVWDIALIRLDEGVVASPQMAHFGGPTGLHDELSAEPTLLYHYGWGVHGVNGEPEVEDCCAFEQPAHGRTALATSMADPFLVRVVDLAGGGDSGSAVISADGRAVGIVSAANYAGHSVTTAEGVETGNGVYVRLGPQIAFAERNLGIQLRLETAPLLE